MKRKSNVNALSLNACYVFLHVIKDHIIPLKINSKRKEKVLMEGT